MKKYWLIGAVLLVVIIIIAATSGSEPETQSRMPSGVDPANTTYLIEGELVTLSAGEATGAPVEDSSTPTLTRIFDNPVVGDLDADGDLDMALLLARETGGSGTFFYLAAALQNPDTTAQGTNALFIGDRIA